MPCARRLSHLQLRLSLGSALGTRPGQADVAVAHWLHDARHSLPCLRQQAEFRLEWRRVQGQGRVSRRGALVLVSNGLAVRGGRCPAALRRARVRTTLFSGTSCSNYCPGQPLDHYCPKHGPVHDPLSIYLPDLTRCCVRRFQASKGKICVVNNNIPHWLIRGPVAVFLESLEDQLGRVRGTKSKIEDGSDLGTYHTQVTSVGDLAGAQRLRLPSWSPNFPFFCCLAQR